MGNTNNRDIKLPVEVDEIIGIAQRIQDSDVGDYMQSIVFEAIIGVLYHHKDRVPNTPLLNTTNVAKSPPPQ